MWLLACFLPFMATRAGWAALLACGARGRKHDRAVPRFRRPPQLGKPVRTVHSVLAVPNRSCLVSHAIDRPASSVRPFASRSKNTVRAEMPSAVWFSERLDIIQLGADRVLAVVDQHVLRNSVIEKAHAELVIRLFDAGIHRKKGKPDAPARPLQQRTEPHRCGVRGELDTNRRRHLNRVLIGGAVENLAREKVFSLTGLIDQQDRMRAGK